GAGRFAAMIESDVSIVADRTIVHGAPYAADTGAAVEASATWYIPGASTRNGLDLTLALFNPARAAASVDLTLVPPGGPAVTRRYALAAGQRIEVDGGSLDSALANTDFAIVASADAPIVAEATASTADGRIATSPGVEAVPSGLWFTA